MSKTSVLLTARKRAAFAALKAFAAEAGTSSEPILENLTDLLADLMHTYNCFPDALRIATGHYEHEVANGE